jgi:H+-transporting ATPase
MNQGAPHVLLKLVGKPEMTEAVEKEVHAMGLKGIRSLAVARTNATGEWEFLGLLTFLDPPRPDTKLTIEQTTKYGLGVKMITGDHLLIARETARRLGMGDFIKHSQGLPLLDAETKQKPLNLGRDFGDMFLAADGFAEVFPEHKYLIVECFRELGYKTGMTGDGVNDAPALKRADVGIAVQGATDAARAAADIILTKPGLSTIVTAIVVARVVVGRMRNYITYRIAATLQLLFFFFIAVFAFPPNEYQPRPLREGEEEWPVFFRLPVLMLMLITALNDGTLISVGYDNVIPKKTPEKWNIGVMFLMGSVLGAVALCSSIFLLWMSLDSHNPDGVYQKLGIGAISYGQVTTSMYLKVSVSDFLTVFSSRTGGHFFWHSRPATILLVAAMVALGVSTINACLWPSSNFVGVPVTGLIRKEPKLLALYIWIYCVFWWLVQVR